MPWLFIILGLAVFISGLYGLITALQAKRLFVLEGLELVLLGGAMFMHHTSTAGWVALFAALAVEVARHSVARRQVPSSNVSEPASIPANPVIEKFFVPPPIVAPFENKRVESEAPQPPAMPSPAPLPLTPLQPPKPTAPPLISIALLRTPWQPAPEVFLASLRRGGERGAKLTSSTPGQPIRISVEGLFIELKCVERPLPRPQLEEAAGQSWDWPDAAKTVAAHVGQVLFTSQAGGDGRAAGLRLHCRAQLALAEFAPVLAVLWPAAGRLIPITSISHLASLPGDFDLAKATCINFRTFPLEGNEAGRFTAIPLIFRPRRMDLEVECDALERQVRRRFINGPSRCSNRIRINGDGTTFECDSTCSAWTGARRAFRRTAKPLGVSHQGHNESSIQQKNCWALRSAPSVFSVLANDAHPSSRLFFRRLIVGTKDHARSVLTVTDLHTRNGTRCVRMESSLLGVP